MGVGAELVLVGRDLELRLVRGREVAGLQAVGRDVGLVPQLGGRVLQRRRLLAGGEAGGVGLGDGEEEEAPRVVALEFGRVDAGRRRVPLEPALADREELGEGDDAVVAAGQQAVAERRRLGHPVRADLGGV